MIMIDRICAMEFDIGHTVYIIANMLFSTVLSKTLSERNEKKIFRQFIFMWIQNSNKRAVSTTEDCLNRYRGSLHNEHNWA